MPVHRYCARPPIQLTLPGFKPNPMVGLKLTRDKLNILDGEMCDVATRHTRGRLHNILEEDYLRTPFERDVQRIRASELFFRTKDKTQVFPLPIDPAIRNRFTHSIEVAGLSESICQILRLNPDLAKAQGLTHDVGHSPFGHAGERILDAIRQKELKLYHKHNIFGLILIDDLYRSKDTGQPLDLTFETRDGMLCHLGETTEREIIPYGALPNEPPKDPSLKELKRGNVRILEEHRVFFPATLEGGVTRFADRIAAVARDVEDAVRHEIIKWKDLPDLCQKVFADGHEHVHSSSIIKALVESLIYNSWNPTHHTIYSLKFGDREADALNKLYDFNSERIYHHPDVRDKFLYFVPYIMHNLYLDYTLDRGMSVQEAINAIAYLTDREAIAGIERIKKSKFELKPIV